MNNPRYLIVTADDFCMSRSISEGILLAREKGIVTTTSALINYPGALEMIREAHERYPDFPIGLHLNITSGRPVLPPDAIPTLVDKNGYFYHADKIIGHLSKIDLNQLRAELNAQVNLFLSSSVPLDHLDSENHMLALYTPFFAIVKELARLHHVPVRNPAPVGMYRKIKVKKGSGSSKAFLMLMKYAVLHPVKSLRMMRYTGPAALKKQGRLLREEQIPAADWFVDSFYGNASEETLISILEQLPEGISELMTHPGIIYAEDFPPGADTSYTYPREEELNVLISPLIKNKLKELNIHLVDNVFLKK